MLDDGAPCPTPAQMVDVPDPVFTEAAVSLQADNAPDRVLVIGATGHVGRVFLEQGLELFPNTEFRALLRDLRKSRDLPSGLDCREGDVRDARSRVGDGGVARYEDDRAARITKFLYCAQE